VYVIFVYSIIFISNIHPPVLEAFGRPLPFIYLFFTGSFGLFSVSQTPRLVRACERQARVFWGGALRCLACSESEENAEDQK
jgi:hypothetical protein